MWNVPLADRSRQEYCLGEANISRKGWRVTFSHLRARGFVRAQCNLRERSPEPALLPRTHFREGRACRQPQAGAQTRTRKWGAKQWDETPSYRIAFTGSRACESNLNLHAGEGRNVDATEIEANTFNMISNNFQSNEGYDIVIWHKLTGRVSDTVETISALVNLSWRSRWQSVQKYYS